MIKWRVGISNGQNFTEDDKYFPVIVGQDSPWIRMMNYVESNYLEITSLCLIDGDKIFNLPSAGKNPKFTAFLNSPKPIEYRFGRVVGGFVGKGSTEVFARIEAVYEDKILQLWVDEGNTNLCYALVI